MTIEQFEAQKAKLLQSAAAEAARAKKMSELGAIAARYNAAVKKLALK